MCLLAVCCQPACHAQGLDTLFPEAAQAKSVLKLWATEYYVHITEEGGSIPFLSLEGDTLAFCTTECDFCTASLEGTVFLTDDSGSHKVLNYAGRADNAQVPCRLCERYTNSTLNVESWGSVRWKMSSGYGEGVKGYKLVPYRTIAVDPSVIPYGSVVYIPAARGSKIVLDNGSEVQHDGFFFAGDTGGAIKGTHIDVFTGIDATHPFAFVRSSSAHSFDAWIVEDETLQTSFRKLHGK